MADSVNHSVAERRLLCSRKNSNLRAEVVFRLGSPRATKGLNSAGLADGEMFECEVGIAGLEAPSVKYFGMDSVQALQLAADLDPLIRRLSIRYDFFWLTGEPYFDEGE
jgi:hypothetical protein